MSKDYKIIDLAQVLSGIGFPETKVPVILNEGIAFEVAEAEEALKLAEIRQDNKEGLKKVYDRLEELKESVKNQLITVHIKGIPEATRKACNTKASIKYPITYSFMNQEEPSAERNELYHTLLWEASIIKIETPDGGEYFPDTQGIVTLREQLGRSAIGAISEGIESLVTGVNKGFESSVQDIDFLSESSLAE